MMVKETKNTIQISRKMETATHKMNMVMKKEMINNKDFMMMRAMKFHKRKLRLTCANNKNNYNTRKMNKIMERKTNMGKNKMNIEF